MHPSAVKTHSDIHSKFHWMSEWRTDLMQITVLLGDLSPWACGFVSPKTTLKWLYTILIARDPTKLTLCGSLTGTLTSNFLLTLHNSPLHLFQSES